VTVAVYVTWSPGLAGFADDVTDVDVGSITVSCKGSEGLLLTKLASPE
jgi:hypothetical protein